MDKKYMKQFDKATNEPNGKQSIRCFNCGRWNEWEYGKLHPDCECGNAQYTSHNEPKENNQCNKKCRDTNDKDVCCFCPMDCKANLCPCTCHKEKSVEDRYAELILAVINKYPNETRHQTALRYIRQAENNLYNKL